MMLGLVLMVAGGLLVMNSDSSTSEASDKGATAPKKDDQINYTDEYVRARLHNSYYDNYECYLIARDLRRDRPLQREVEHLQRRGLTFQEAIEELEVLKKLK